jgi:hypothetical protein
MEGIACPLQVDGCSCWPRGAYAFTRGCPLRKHVGESFHLMNWSRPYRLRGMLQRVCADPADDLATATAVSSSHSGNKTSLTHAYGNLDVHYLCAALQAAHRFWFRASEACMLAGCVARSHIQRAATSLRHLEEDIKPICRLMPRMFGQVGPRDHGHIHTVVVCLRPVPQVSAALRSHAIGVGTCLLVVGRTDRQFADCQVP